jgi:hypothetical protein
MQKMAARMSDLWNMMQLLMLMLLMVSAPAPTRSRMAQTTSQKVILKRRFSLSAHFRLRHDDIVIAVGGQSKKKRAGIQDFCGLG